MGIDGSSCPFLSHTHMSLVGRFISVTTSLPFLIIQQRKQWLAKLSSLEDIRMGEGSNSSSSYLKTTKPYSCFFLFPLVFFFSCFMQQNLFQELSGHFMYGPKGLGKHLLSTPFLHSRERSPVSFRMAISVSVLFIDKHSTFISWCSL